jgi:hypothetical protein
MDSATKVAKQLINKGESGATAPAKVVGFQLAATAPDAFEAPDRITTIAMSDTGKPPSKPRPDEPLPALPSKGSPLALREEHRLIRSQPNYSTRKPLDPWKESDESKMGFRDFDTWNPPSLEDEGWKEPAVMDTSSLSSKIVKKAKATKAFWSRVDDIVRSGIETSSGSNHTLPVPDLSQKSLEQIVSRIPSQPDFLNSQLMQDTLDSEIVSVQKQYHKDAAEASSILYEGFCSRNVYGHQHQSLVRQQCHGSLDEQGIHDQRMACFPRYWSQFQESFTHISQD